MPYKQGSSTAAPLLALITGLGRPPGTPKGQPGAEPDAQIERLQTMHRIHAVLNAFQTNLYLRHLVLC